MHSSDKKHLEYLEYPRDIIYTYHKRKEGLQWNSDFSNHLAKSKYEVQSIGRLEKSGVRFQCLIGKWTSSLVRVIGNFENRVFEKSGYYCTLLLLTHIQLTLITK